MTRTSVFVIKKFEKTVETDGERIKKNLIFKKSELKRNHLKNILNFHKKR